MQKCVLDLTNVCDNCHQMTIVLCDDVGFQSSKRCFNLSLFDYSYAKVCVGTTSMKLQAWLGSNLIGNPYKAVA